MSFLQPWAAWFLAAIPLIVVLYLLRLKRRSLTVSTHLFWQRVLQESSRRALFHRLRHILSLLLHLLIFTLLVGALARPLLHHATHDAASTVILLDTRARMQAIEPDGESRFSKAVVAARKYLRQAHRDRQFALLTLARHPGVTVPFTDDDRALIEGLENVKATDAPGDLSHGLKLARTLLAGRKGPRRIIVLTDHPPVADPSSPEILVTFHAFGSSRDNVAITRFAARSNPANPATAEVLLEIHNFGHTPIKTDLELAFDGRPFEVKPLELAPGQQHLDIFSSLPRPARGARGWITASLKVSDAFPTDNVAYATLPVRQPRRILLVSPGNPFLEKLLAVDPNTRFQLLDPTAWQNDLSPKFEVVIFDKFTPPGFDLAQPAGNFLFIRSAPFPSGSPPLDRPLVTHIDADHPAVRNVNLQNLIIQRAEAISAPSNVEGWTYSTPIRSFDHPLLILGAGSDRRIAAIAFDVLESDLPLRIAFPLLVSNLLQWLEGKELAPPPSLIAGETFRLSSTQRVHPDPLTSIPKQPLALESATLLQPAHNGYYLLADGEQQQWIAVNTFSREESDLRVAPANFTADPIAASLPQIGARPPWFWLTLAALILFTTEWWLFHRRRTE